MLRWTHPAEKINDEKNVNEKKIVDMLWTSPAIEKKYFKMEKNWKKGKRREFWSSKWEKRYLFNYRKRDECCL